VTIKKIEVAEGNQTIQEKLEVLRNKINEIIEYVDNENKKEP